MSTISGSDMGIALALKGSVAVLHRNCSIEEQVNMVKTVKRFTNSVIENPKTILSSTIMVSATVKSV
jgi:IMP dehydrogenase